MNNFVADDFNVQDYDNDLNINDKINFLTTAEFKKIQPIYRGSNYVYLTVLQNNLNDRLLSINKPIEGLMELFDFVIMFLAGIYILYFYT